MTARNIQRMAGALQVSEQDIHDAMNRLAAHGHRCGHTRRWNMQTIDTRSVSAIYCDDIRQEVGGKMTVVETCTRRKPVRFPSQGGVMLHKVLRDGVRPHATEPPPEKPGVRIAA